MTPLPNTPNPQAPGDRQALQNASRRAERSGTPGPEKINVQAVREALGKATTTDDYVRLNREIGNEIVYLRRGEKQEIYGCKIRRTGSTEWVKMSTLAKDLSWPRIAHRFAESPVMAPAPTVEVPAAPKPATKYDRAPAMLKQTLLRPPPPPHQLAAATQSPAEPEPGKKWGIDLQKVDALNMGPLSQAMLLLGAAAINCSLAVIRMIVEFLKRLLARFGFGMTPIQQVANVQAAPAQVAFEPYVLEAQTREVVGQAQVDDAAAQVYRLAEAVRSKDAFLLPRGEGREELAAAIEADAGAPSEMLNDPLARLQAAGAAYLSARQAVVQASSRPPASLMLVAAAREALGKYGDELGDAQLAFQRELECVADPMLKARLDLMLKKSIKKFADLPIECRPETLQEGVELVKEARRQAAKGPTLPVVEGRAEMLADPGRQPEQNALDSMFAADVAHAATPAPVAPEVPPAAPPKTALVQFLEAAKAFSLTSSLVRGALEKDIKYVDRQPAARAARDAAMTEHAELTEARRIWKSDNKVLSTLGADPHKFAARIEAAQKRVVAAEKLVDQAERRHGEFEKLWDRTPVPSVPFALQDRHAAATENFKKAQQLLISKARLNLTVLDTNPMLRQKRETFGALIRRAETQLAAFLVDPRTQPKVVKDVDEMIRNLAAEVNIERARQAPRHDVEDGQNADEAGQHGHAVPGQR